LVIQRFEDVPTRAAVYLTRDRRICAIEILLHTEEYHKDWVAGVSADLSDDGAAPALGQEAEGNRERQLEQHSAKSK
jgi:hypothetical protein